MNPGPAGIPQFEYIFSRIICTSVPLGFTALLVILVFAGIKYLMSAGEPKAVSQAHQTVTWGLLGVVFLAISWLILQLIQNFTGIQVTKFTLSSLPGVDGFTGSCWEQAPIAPNPPPVVMTKDYSDKKTGTKTTNITSDQVAKNDSKDSSTDQISCNGSNMNNNIYLECKIGQEVTHSWPISCTDIPGFDYSVTQCLAKCPDKYFDSLGNDSFIREVFSTVTSGNVVYNTDVIPGFEEIVDKPVFINLGQGSKDNALYQLNEKNQEAYISVMAVQSKLQEFSDISVVQQRIQLKVAVWGDGPSRSPFMAFEKNKIPTGLIEAMHHSQKIGEKIMLKEANGPYTGTTFSTVDEISRTDFDSVALGGFNCPNATYYTTFTFSPLLYFYPEMETNIEVAIKSPIISTVPGNKNTWLIKAFPNGNLITPDNKKIRFLPYEFLRRDFKKPEKGIVASADKLVEYLRSNLWKKLGLTDTEIEDYWQDIGWRIPKSPYYFISLIDRSEIDRVLPMEINPKPDTLLRNMTYILPLSSPFIPTPLPNEQLKAPQRNGFTVLENGGFIDGF